jgi:hypothetical protein
MASIFTHKVDEILTSFREVTESDENTVEFFKNFSYSNIINQNHIKMNSVNVFTNANNENTTKSTIISYLNKLNARNISKITSSLREIAIVTMDDLNELVTQCITKLRKDTEQMKPITAKLCYELLATYFVTETGEKVYFRNILLSQIKTEYVQSMRFGEEDWTKETSEKTTVLIGILFNNYIIPENVLTSIIDNYKKKIAFPDTESEANGLLVEQVIGQFMILLSSIVLNNESIRLFDGLAQFIDGELLKYNERKLISKKIGLVCKNLFYEVEKFNASNGQK